MRHHSRPFLQLLLQHRADLFIGGGKQINGDQIRRADVLLEKVTMDDAGDLLQAQTLDLFRALAHQFRIEFDACGIGVEPLRGHDHDAPVAAAKVEHFFARLKFAELQHPLDDGFRRRIIGSQLLRLLFGGLPQ